MGFPGGSDVKNPPASAGDPGSIPGSGRSPGEGNGNPLQHSCLGNPSRGQRSLAGYRPSGCKESDTTEQLNTHTHRSCRWTENELAGKSTDQGKQVKQSLQPPGGGWVRRGEERGQR